MSEPKRLGKHTEARAGEFLFQKGDLDEGQYLDMRTRIKSEKAMTALIHYGILFESMGCEEAGEVGGLIKRLFIAKEGLGRTEAVDILRQNFPKKVEIHRGQEDVETYTSKAIKTVE